MRESALWPALAQYWHPVAFAGDVGEKPLAVRLLDERVAVCRIGGKVRAFHDLCIHRGTPISLGWVEGETLVCAYHGWSYDADGRCVRIPSLPPGHPIPKKACLTSYQAEERYGFVWVCLAEQARAPIPDFPEHDDPGFRIFFQQRKFWRCSAARAIENFVDLAHFAWVHEGILGDRAHPRTPDIEVKRKGEDLWFGYQNIPDGLHPVSHTRNYRLTRPFTIYQWKVEENGKKEVYFHTITPHSAKECTRFLLVARNYDLDAPEVAHGPVRIRDGEFTVGDNGAGAAVPEYVRVMDTIAVQDQVVVENQRPEELPLDLSEELHLKGPDAVALAYRRLLGELGVDT
ncbi:MAG: aromatic ring-hydroxylating dioxygenase subunit alpha [Candidatus Tectomicrobia bacterium]|nr:aromatic ring-hydroxylating dioxygenase subunit alpha [Candidatus Tectomicrobia bacterium]